MTDAAIFPSTYQEAADALAADPALVPIAGGTDIMVEVNAGQRRVDRWLSLDQIHDSRSVRELDTGYRLGAGTTFNQIITEHAYLSSALTQAARTVGSAQIRAVATLGGNVATASPAGDSLPVLACLDTTLRLVSANGERTVALDDFLVGPKTTLLQPDELVAAIDIGSTRGNQWFAKLGRRNAMVIAVCSLAGRLDEENGIARIALGSAGPTILRARQAENLLLEGAPAEEVANEVVAAARAIGDHRASKEYREHALRIIAGRMSSWLRENNAP